MLIDDDIPSLDSLEPEGALGFEERIAALESSLENATSHIESRILARIQRIEDSFVSREENTRHDLITETTARQKQIATLAGKLCRFMDRVNLSLPAANHESSPSELTAPVHADVEDAREHLSREVAKLRSEFKSLLDSSQTAPGS